MESFWVYPLALLVGILFNLNPSCGSGSLIWASTQTQRKQLIALALTRISVLALVGASATLVGSAIRKPWGILMLITAGYLFYTTIHQSQAKEFSCSLSTGSKWLPWVMAFVPPPSGFIGLALFYGGFTAPNILQGALTLGLVGVGLTLPVWLLLVFPNLQAHLQKTLMEKDFHHHARLVVQFLGALIFALVGLSFIVIEDFHRPLLEILQK